MNWLDHLKQTLDSSHEPVSFFFRDDDAGWEDTRLFALLDLFAGYEVPLDLAVIPTLISKNTAARLRSQADGSAAKLSFHQHGYAHVNHEPMGRKCEFGESRPSDLQLADIEAGKHLLRDLFGSKTDRFFTPPWNRCTPATASCLRSAGFELLSRDSTASPLNADGLRELPISVDWFARRKGIRVSADELGESLSSVAQQRRRVGVMLHHAVMNYDERARLGELLQLLSSHSQARCLLMRDLIQAGE